ncbi:dentin matrix acidic phosphoprotein 1-like, partial [Littorina saxatilis]|uniref:dentin matrix acidic phosphoprotein 1-like n=1 Tax=Littorina saxatilis TaxID=31220 RepID=UPI0038B64871
SVAISYHYLIFLSFKFKCPFLTGERQSFDRETFTKAVEEEKAEKRRQDAVEEAKQKKKKRRKMKEEAEEDEEESAEREEEGEEEDRKENNKKRQIKKLHQEGGMFPPYKKTKRGRSAAGHNDEVVEILMSMSQGKLAAGKEEMDDSASDAGSVDSFVSSTSSKSNSAAFVPKVARPTLIMKGQRSSPSSRNVVVESEVPDPESPMSIIGPSLRSMPLQGENIVNINQSLVPQYEIANGTAGDGSTPSNGVDNNSGASSSAPALTIPAGGQVVDIASFIDGLQTQTSQPVDVVLVEQQAEGGQQGLVHVYLVPRAAEGGEENSVQSERDSENRVQSERGGENSVQNERGGENSVQSERGGENNVQSERGGENSVQSERGGENSYESERGGEKSAESGEKQNVNAQSGSSSVLSERTSLLGPHSTGNDSSDPQSDRNNQQLVVGNAHIVQVMDVEGVNSQNQGGERNSLQHDGGNVRDIEIVNSLNQGGEKNSLQHVGSNVYSAQMMRNESTISQNQEPGVTVSTVLSQGSAGSNAQIKGVEPNTTQDLGAVDEIVIDEDTWNSIQTEEVETDISYSVSHASSSGHVREVIDLTVDEVTF